MLSSIWSIGAPTSTPSMREDSVPSSTLSVRAITVCHFSRHFTFLVITEYLLVQGANCLVTLNGGFNLLMYAAMNGDCQHIQILQRYILIDAVDEDGLSPLMYTAVYKCTEAMNLLLSMNANPYLVSKEGKTVTYLCIEQGYEDGLRLLVQHHVSLDVLGTITSHSSLYSACFMKYRNIARFLLQEDTNMAGFLDDLCCTSDRIAQSIVEVGLQELYLTMSKERKVYIQTTFLDGCRKYGEYLLSYVTSPSHVRFPCSQIADIFIYCIKISKMLCDRSQQLHVCDSIWKHIEQTFNKLHYLCTHCTNPDQIVRPSFLTRVLFTFLEGYCLCYSSINSSKEEEEKKINIIRCQALIFNDQTLVHFLLKNKTLLLYVLLLV